MNKRKYINELKKYEPIYVIGHSNIDIDSAISSKLLSEILSFFGIKANYAILDSNYIFDEYNKSMLEECTKFEPKKISKQNIKKYNFFLVDHNDFLQSVGPDANIIGCIDHHPNSRKVKNVIITDCCATSLFLYKFFKEIYDFSSEQKYEIFMAFLNDSTFGKSSRYKSSDEALIKELGFIINYDELFKKYFKPTDLTRGVKNALFNGHKKYQFEYLNFESGYIESFGIKGMDEYENIIKTMQNFLGIWIDYNIPKTYVFFSYKNNFMKWKYNFVASRATTILNDVMNIINRK